MTICGKEYCVRGRLVKTACLATEGFEYVENPEEVLESLRTCGHGADVFTFMQRLPKMLPEHKYFMEWDNLAALPVSTYEHWWTRQIDGKTRNMVRRAEKKGVTVRDVAFDSALVNGIWEIYNECPVRQGKPFPHYGKDMEAVHKMSATFMETSFFIGAFLGEKLIGFMKLTADEARSQAGVMHIIAMIQHRDKAPTNALIAQAVRSCEEREIPHVVYSKFAYGKKERDNLSDFKESNGFQRVDLPRYYVPLTGIGRLAIRLGLHHGFRDHIPAFVLGGLREFRKAWYKRKPQSVTDAS